jgi:hypothetical protein
MNVILLIPFTGGVGAVNKLPIIAGVGVFICFAQGVRLPC